MRSVLICFNLHHVFIIFFLNGYRQKPELIIPIEQNLWAMATKISSDGKYTVSSAMNSLNGC